MHDERLAVFSRSQVGDLEIECRRNKNWKGRTNEAIFKAGSPGKRLPCKKLHLVRHERNDLYSDGNYSAGNSAPLFTNTTLMFMCCECVVRYAIVADCPHCIFAPWPTLLQIK
jgi:hypothetical protein